MALPVSSFAAVALIKSLVLLLVICPTFSQNYPPWGPEPPYPYGHPPPGNNRPSPPGSRNTPKSSGGKDSVWLVPHFSDQVRLQFVLNLEFLEAEFFCYGALGYGIDTLAPTLAKGGPPPIGAQKARHLTPLVQDLAEQLCYQEIGHLRAIEANISSATIPRPQLDLSVKTFQDIINAAFGHDVDFNVYGSTNEFLIGCALLPQVGGTGYVQLLTEVTTPTLLRLIGGLLAVEVGQDALLRDVLWDIREETVGSSGKKVNDFMTAISKLRNKLGRSDGENRDEGLKVSKELGAEGRVTTNILSGDDFSLGFSRTTQEILRIIYGSGKETQQGGWFPKGCNGEVAQFFLNYMKANS